MFILIPSTQYAATVEGSIIKDVTCEKCGHTYSYRMSRIVSGSEKVLFSSSRGSEKALKKARANLAKALETEHDDVPCPACKWHQSSHVAYVRSQSYPQLKTLAGAFFIFAGLALGLILFFFALFLLLLPDHEVPKASSILQFALIVLAIASPGLLLRGFRSLLLLSYRPNS
jgi:DNA-directed RNA polymerase subunit M/transcription elongation factor TFIIS